MSGINFEQWGAVDQLEARRMARDPDLKPMAYRVMFAAIGWANLIGHAEFAGGGLAVVLQKSNPRTGEMSIPGQQHVSNVIREARARGLVGDGSNVRCLVVPDWFEKAGGTGGRTCSEHGIRPPRRRRRETNPVTEQPRNETGDVTP